MSATTAPRRKAARNNNSKKPARGFLFPMFVCVIGGELVTIVLAGFFAFVFALVDLPDVVVTGFAFVALIVGRVGDRASVRHGHFRRSVESWRLFAV